MKRCELCSNPARIYCEADGASLCCDCDEKVHSANFLVAKHSRNLLCHVCQSQTPWNASGTKLGLSVSVCEICVENFSGKQGGRDSETEGGGEDDNIDVDFEGEDDYADDYEDGELSESGEDDDEEEEGGDNQVVPWSSSCTPPPPVSSSSSSEEMSSYRISSAGGGGGSASKRLRVDADLDSEDEIGCTSSQLNPNTESIATSSQVVLQNHEADSSGLLRKVKVCRPNEAIRSEKDEERNQAGSTSAIAMFVSKIRRLHQNTMFGCNDERSIRCSDGDI